MFIDVVKVILPAILTFVVGIGLTPFLTNYLYKNKMWKKKVKAVASDGRSAEIFQSLNKDKEINTPRMGGIIIWSSTFFVVSFLWILAFSTELEIIQKLEFLSRNQTWIPLSVLILGALVGLFDDWLEVRGEGDNLAGGLSSKKRLAFVALVGALVAIWFHYKLEVSTILIPFLGELNVGLLIVPIFIILMLAVYSGGVIDGVDGLAGGVFASMFAAYAVIAFSLEQFNLAAFCASLVGGILAFLWFNIPPARFYMSETGSMALTITLAVVALITDSIGKGVGLTALLIISLPLTLTAASSFIQLASKRFRNGKKIFLSAPVHQHFMAIGWPSYKVTMRYWIISIFLSFVGIVLALIAS